MQYNASLYNEDEYNLTEFDLNLLEDITSSDVLTKSIEITRTDSQGSADAISDGVSLAALLDTVTIYQRAQTPFAYNNGRYNDFMYNSRADEDEILLMPTKVLPENIFPTDTLAPFISIKGLSDIMSETDALLLFSSDFVYNDFVFLSELFRIEVTNKGLNDTIRMADWLSIERNPANDEWTD